VFDVAPERRTEARPESTEEELRHRGVRREQTISKEVGENCSGGVRFEGLQAGYESGVPEYIRAFHLRS